MVTDSFGRDLPRDEAIAMAPPGWSHLVGECWDACDRHDVAIYHIKEKFGGLRFYVETAPDDVHAVIERAEAASETTCQECGASGIIKPNSHGWLKCLCDKCRPLKGA
jgi:hypothetical protein